MLFRSKDTYPWQKLNCSNIVYYPTVIPEITEATENKDGSITLKVNVMCLDNKTDCLFTHEVIVMPSDNGSFKYLGGETQAFIGYNRLWNNRMPIRMMLKEQPV